MINVKDLESKENERQWAENPLITHPHSLHLVVYRFIEEYPCFNCDTRFNKNF